MTQPRILLAAKDPTPELLTALAGYAVSEIPLAPAELPLNGVEAVVVDAGASPAAAIALTHQIRADTGDRLFPVVWLVPEPSSTATVAALDAGAYVCPARPLEPAVLLATLRAAVRAHTVVARYEQRAADGKIINTQLQAEYRISEAAVALARRVQEVLRPPRPHAFGPFRMALATTATACRADVVRLDDDRVGFWLAEVVGATALTAELISLFTRLAVQGREDHDAGWRILPPAEVLDRVNRGLIRLDLDPQPLVGLAYGRLDLRGGSVTVARAGLPPAIHLPTGEEAMPWSEGGPFLGAFDAVFFPHDERLSPGDRLVLATRGTPEEVRTTAVRHRDQPLQEMAGRMAKDLEAATVLAVERTARPN